MEKTNDEEITVVEYLPGKHAGKNILEKRALEKMWAMADVYLTHIHPSLDAKKEN